MLRIGHDHWSARNETRTLWFLYLKTKEILKIVLITKV